VSVEQIAKARLIDAFRAYDNALGVYSNNFREYLQNDYHLYQIEKALTEWRNVRQRTAKRQ